MKKHFILFCLACTVSWSLLAQENFRVMFYNVENLFDTEKESGKNDGEFLPTGKKYWNSKKYYLKLVAIAKVITAVGEWDTPSLVGMCEVENDRVMKDLTLSSPLKAQRYKYVMTDCDDRRGIDNALLYQADRFRLLSYKAYKVRFDSPQKVSRDILHVTGLVKSGDTIDVFVCHYPSRLGGEKASEAGRIRVSEVVREKAEHLHRIRQKPHIIIMGDFNDEPSNSSISKTLKAQEYKPDAPIKPSELQLFNLFSAFEKQDGKGSHKYRGHWGMLDQIIVSGRLLSPTSGFKVVPASARIFSPDFILTKDKSGGGKRPKRSYLGMKYEAGFSDHLPVYADFVVSSLL
jgi:endonuclease/exonuclease/phosphatase family metal-dependent hydrolase